MRALVRDFDWAATPLGPMSAWPAGLRTVTDVLLVQPTAMIVLWGPEFVQIYNDAFRLIMGDKHPAGLGQPNRVCWPEVWSFNAPIYEQVLRGGSVEYTDQPLSLNRQGTPSTGYFTLSYGPVQGASGQVEGVLVTVVETTARVLAEQRSQDQSDEVQSRNQVLEAFSDLTRDLAAETDPYQLIRRAQEVVLELLPSGFSQYFELEDGLWQVRSQVGQANTPELQAILDAGLPFERTPNLSTPWQSGQSLYQGQYDHTADQISGSDAYPAATAVLPVAVGGRPRGVLGFALVERQDWTPMLRATLETVRSSLSSALERAEAVAQLGAQNSELEARTRALEGFGDLTRELSVQRDPYALIRRAQEVAMSLLPPGYALYYEPDGGRWTLRSQVGEIRNPALQAVIDAGLPFGQPHNLLRPWTSGQPHYQDRYDHADSLGDLTRDIGSTATLPLSAGGQRLGVFGVALYQARGWSPVDKAVLETTVRSLALALERAQQARQIEEERAALEAFAALTEAVGSETDVRSLAKQATEMLRARFPDASVGYYEPQAGRWTARVWTQNVSEQVIGQMTAGFTDQTPMIVRVLQASNAVFIDDWNPVREAIPHTEEFGAVGNYPLLVEGQVRGLLSVGLRRLRHWSERDKALVRSVGRSLNLALERTEQARALTVQRDALDARTRDLAAANHELEAFAYSVSHDLRTPVRHIAGFTGLLRQALGVAPGEKVARYLSVIDESAARMDALIDALLNLSRTAIQPLRVEQVDLNALVAGVRADLAADWQGRQIHWQIGPLPRVSGDTELLRQVLTNLLSNALKYTRAQPQAHIEVQADARPGAWAIWVRDNGAGFDPQYAGKLFGVFQRLHRAEEFEGTGVGLANVRRIVARHGGEVFAHSQPGEGATFGFTLPRTD